MIALFFWPAFYADNEAKETVINTSVQRHVAHIGKDRFVTSDHRITGSSCGVVWLASKAETY